MPTITFKAKKEHMSLFADNGDLMPGRRVVKVPKLTQNHCNMHEFRTHSRYGSFANSDMFPSMIARAVKSLGIKSFIDMDSPPDNVTVDDTGFLAVVTITL